jgi:site-specific recombinase XerD
MAMIVRAAEGVPGIPDGFPILLDNHMTIIEVAFAYLIEHATVLGRSHAAETVRTYAEHLHDWFDALEQSGLDWRTADETTVAAYRNRMLEAPSPHTRRPYARSTINDRVRTVCRFYEWAHRRRLVEELPFRFVDVRSTGNRRERGMLAHLDRRPPAKMKANALTVAQRERLPRPMRVDELRKLFAELDRPYRLMAEWAVGTGLRRMELCGLKVSQIPDTANLDANADPLIGVSLTVTKGDRPRTVYPPLRLIDRTHWYVGEERAALVKSIRRRSDFRPPPNLFLNRDGNAVTRARLSGAFNAAFHAAGLDGSLHWLRHYVASRTMSRTFDYGPVSWRKSPVGRDIVSPLLSTCAGEGVDREVYRQRSGGSVTRAGGTFGALHCLVFEVGDRTGILAVFAAEADLDRCQF